MTAAIAPMPRRTGGMRGLEVAMFAIGLLLAGLVLMALLWSGKDAYVDLARANGVSTVTFVDHGPTGSGEARLDLAQLAEWHARWSAYVTGAAPDPPVTFGRQLFGRDEYAHMADVRRVFDGARLLLPLGLLIMAFRLVRARAAGGAQALRLARDGALLAAAVVAVIGLAAAVAFEPAFLLFHRVFFPQGNYLFDPATSNLVRLYPDWYWEGITLRAGASFEAIALGVAAVTTLALRRMK